MCPLRNLGPNKQAASSVALLLLAFCCCFCCIIPTLPFALSLRCGKTSIVVVAAAVARLPAVLRCSCLSLPSVLGQPASHCLSARPPPTPPGRPRSSRSERTLSLSLNPQPSLHPHVWHLQPATFAGRLFWVFTAATSVAFTGASLPARPPFPPRPFRLLSQQAASVHTPASPTFHSLRVCKPHRQSIHPASLRLLASSLRRPFTDTIPPDSVSAGLFTEASLHPFPTTPNLSQTHHYTPSQWVAE